MPIIKRQACRLHLLPHSLQLAERIENFFRLSQTVACQRLEADS
jgi:hypothetical protein